MPRANRSLIVFAKRGFEVNLNSAHQISCSLDDCWFKRGKLVWMCFDVIVQGFERSDDMLVRQYQGHTTNPSWDKRQGASSGSVERIVPKASGSHHPPARLVWYGNVGRCVFRMKDWGNATASRRKQAGGARSSACRSDTQMCSAYS